MEYMGVDAVRQLDGFFAFSLNLSYYATALHESYQNPTHPPATTTTQHHVILHFHIHIHPAFRPIIVPHDDMTSVGPFIRLVLL